jgi:hypothetical protein
MCGGCQGLLLGHFAIKFMRIKTPFTPTMTQETNQPPLEVPHSTGHESGKPLPFVPPITAVQQPAQSTPVQTAPAAAQPAPVTQLDRVVQTDRNLTPGDRNRLSDALFDYAQFLEQGSTLGYRVNTELGKLSQDRSSGALAKNVDEHVKTLPEIGAAGMGYQKTFYQVRDKWKYYPDQTDYIFGENPDNLGPNALINTASGLEYFLADWSKAANREQALNLISTPLNDGTQSLSHYFQWVRESQQRLNQVKQSIQPNGVIQPIPSSTPAPATGMFTLKHDQQTLTLP